MAYCIIEQTYSSVWDKLEECRAADSAFIQVDAFTQPRHRRYTTSMPASSLPWSAHFDRRSSPPFPQDVSSCSMHWNGPIWIRKRLADGEEPIPYLCTGCKLPQVPEILEPMML